MHARRLIIGYLLFFIFSILGVYISGISILIELWGSILTYFIISYCIYFVWKKLRYKETLSFFDFFILFLYRIGLSIFLLVFLLGSFSLYNNELKPAKLPLYTISNGEKTIRFQTMSHVASSNFYSEVRRNIFKAKKEGFVLFFEGVRPGSQESTDGFNAAIGIEFTKGLYSQLSKLYGIEAQDNAMFLNLENDKDYNIDLDLDTIMDVYAKKQSSSNKEQKQETLSPQIQDIELLVQNSIDSLSPRELSILRYINQSLMNMIIKHESLRNGIMHILGKDDIFSVILDERNTYLTQAILKSDEDKIFITYGLMHFDGVYSLLQQSDSNWKIISQEEYQVITR